MKRFKFTLLFPFILILQGCPSSIEPSLGKIQSNKMNFPDLEKRSHDGISYKLSSLFADSFFKEFVIQDNATTKTIQDLHVHFSIETFTKNDIESLKFMTEKPTDDLSMVHDHYIQRRLRSLEEKSVSLKKKAPKSVGFPGFIQVIEGGSTLDEKWASYFTSTIAIDENVYVFQLIGPQDHMGYFYDDFITILNSIEK